MYNINGHLVCLECYRKIKQIDYVDYIKAVSGLNHAIEEMDYVMQSYGVQDNSPKYKIPVFAEFLHQGTPKTYQYINVQNSNVGAINTGNIENIDINMSNLMNSGNNNIVELLKEFTEALINTQEIRDNIKNDILEQLSFVSAQSALPKEKRKGGLVNQF